jgi:hypothetical protein
MEAEPVVNACRHCRLGKPVPMVGRGWRLDMSALSHDYQTAADRRVVIARGDIPPGEAIPSRPTSSAGSQSLPLTCSSIQRDAGPLRGRIAIGRIMTSQAAGNCDA